LAEKYFAALDIGTNSFHMIIAGVKENGEVFIVDREREVLRLGTENTGDKKIISDKEIDKALKTLKRFKKTADSYNVIIEAVATSAVREAENKDEFIAEVFEKTGIKIRAINGGDEAKLIFTGASQALNFKEKDTFCFDIGGGSTEMILRKNGKIIFAESLNLGAVRLSRMFFPDYILSDMNIRECEDYVIKEIKNNSNLIFNREVEINAGTSGTVQSAVLISHTVNNNVSPDKLNGYRISYPEFLKVYSEVIKRKTPDERLQIKGMEAKRADIIPAGFIIMKIILELFKIDDLVYSEYAMREGIILSQFNSQNKN
jgi:exopolyphosphatase / guanosine-5'-triphosphate,3'-diphosphate pyrophosphatase